MARAWTGLACLMAMAIPSLRRPHDRPPTALPNIILFARGWATDDCPEKAGAEEERGGEEERRRGGEGSATGG